MNTNTPKSACRAKNPEFCRYHSTGNEKYNARTEAHYNYCKEKLANARDIEDRMDYTRMLDDIEEEYASTDAGREYFGNLYDETDDWAEKERLQALLESGQRLRDYIEDKADGIAKFPASKLEIAEKRIEKANRKLERAGLEQRFTYTTEEYVETDKDGHAYNMVALSISHPQLSISGWSFVAGIDKTEDGSTITRPMPSQELNGYRPDEFKCDHCGSNRRRNSTYLLRNDDDGEYKQVGSNCLQSFLGVKPSGLWMLDYDPEEGSEFIDKGARHYGGTDTAIPTTELVAAALAVSEGGEKYVSKTVANEWGLTSTVSDVQNYMFSSNRKRWEGVDHRAYLDQAQQMIDETSFEGDNDYCTNMRTLMKQEYTSMKHMGYVSSVISAYKRQKNAVEKVEKPKAVGYLGQPAEKLKDLKLKVTNVVVSEFTYNGYDRTSTMIIMEDDLGRQVKWSASGYRTVEKGDDVTISSATVKENNIYNGNEQTVITRARMTVEPKDL